MERPARIFLAHASEDKPQVREIYEKLRSLGFDPWLDEKDLIAGQNWRNEIPKAIQSSKAFLAILSSRSVAKTGYVQIELRLALANYAMVPPPGIFLIPVRLDECEIPELAMTEIGVNLRNLHWVDLWKPDSWDRLVKALHTALGGVAAKETTTDLQPLDLLKSAIADRNHVVANDHLKRVLLSYAGTEAIRRGFVETLEEANRIPCALLKELEKIFAEAGESDGSLYLFKTHRKDPGQAWGGFGGRVWLGYTVGHRLDECGVNSFKTLVG